MVQVTKLLGALDRCYNSTKKRGGNPTYTEFGYRLVEVAVPSLSVVKGKVPGWVVDTKAIKGELERASRPFINKAASEMPDQDIVEQFLHDYEPKARKYLDAPGDNPANQSDNDAQALHAVAPLAPADAEPSVDAKEPSTIGDAAPPAVAAIAAVAPPAVAVPSTSVAKESAPTSNPNQDLTQPAARSSKRVRKTTAKAAEGAESGEESPGPAARPAKKSKKEPKEPKKPKTPKEPKNPKGKAAKGAKGKCCDLFWLWVLGSRSGRSVF